MWRCCTENKTAKFNTMRLMFKTQMKIRQHVRQTRTNSVKIQVGMSADSMQERGGGEGKTKGGEDH